MPITFGNVPHPPFIDRLIPDAQTRAWDDLGPRAPVGVCQHSMVGSLWGTDGWFRSRSPRAGLTDYGVGNASDGPAWDGVILRWNDPRGRATTVEIGGQRLPVAANRAPWANGGTDGLEGDGPLFVRTLGIAAVNRDLVSIERSDGGDVHAAMSAKQVEAICRLTAHWFDQARVPWDTFPLNPAHGVVTHLLHYEFATKTCPHAPVTSRIDEIQDRVRQILKSAQTGEVATDPVAPAAPIRPDHEWWPQGYDLATLTGRFGLLDKRQPGATAPSRHGFDPRGAIGNAWVARGVAERLRARDLPAPRTWWALDGAAGLARDVVVFDGGWTLYRPDPAVAWRWVQ